ncbi:hypothetical protein J6590_004261 [Homalodisca vitripennis]|nr:hypothetical protein J6590_004261 [Homalodisca vitripennis]
MRDEPSARIATQIILVLTNIPIPGRDCQPSRASRPVLIPSRGIYTTAMLRRYRVNRGRNQIFPDSGAIVFADNKLATCAEHLEEW